MVRAGTSGASHAAALGSGPRCYPSVARRCRAAARIADVGMTARPRGCDDGSMARGRDDAGGTTAPPGATRDQPWLMRTYSGHSTAKASNELYRTNLAKGQTGLSIAFDLPTQTGYDPDDPLARGEVGKVGVPVAHLGHMRELLDGIPLGEMNTSMTINAPAAWLLGLYVANAENQGVESQPAARHDAERHRQGVPEPRHLHLPARAQPAADRRHDRVLQRVGPEVEPDERVQLPPAGGRGHAGAGDRLQRWPPPSTCSTRCASRARSPRTASPAVVASISFFVNAGIRFVEETCKMRAFTELWDRIAARALRRHRPQGPPLPLRRAGQLARPHRGAAREQRAAHRARDARRHPVEAGPGPVGAAAGVERGARPAPPVGPAVVAAHPAGAGVRDRPARVRRHLRRQPRRSRPRRPSWSTQARAELDDVLALGGAFAAIDELKGRLVASNTERTRRIEIGRADRRRASTPSPRRAESPLGGEENILKVDPAVQDELIADVQAWRSNRDNDAVKRSLDELRRVAESGENIMPATIDLAHAGGTTGEWAGAAPRGVRRVPRADRGGRRRRRRRRARRRCATWPSGCKALPGGPPRFLVAKPGPRRALQRRRADRGGGPRRRHGGHLPGHPPHPRADRGGGPGRGRRRRRPVDPVGQPPRAGPRRARRLREAGRRRAGGGRRASSPRRTGPAWWPLGVAAVYTPKDFELGRIMAEIVGLAESHRQT